MKYCSHCGKEVSDEAAICMNCGCALNCVSDLETNKAQKSEKTLPIVAFVLAIVGAFLIIVSYCSAFTTNTVLFYSGTVLMFFSIPVEFGISVASLVCGILTFSKYKESKSLSKNLALAAIVISTVLIVLIVALVMIYYLGYDLLPGAQSQS